MQATGKFTTGPQAGQTFTFTVPLCGYTSAAEASDDPFFPFALGSTWTYEDSGDSYQIVQLED